MYHDGEKKDKQNIKMSQYLKSCQTKFWKQVFEKELEYLLKELQGCKDILSVGCGPAIIEKGLQENGFNITGLDVSKEAISEVPDSVRTTIGSAEKMEFDSGKFDAVIFVASLQFIDDYSRALQETARVLKPNGKLLAMLLNPKSEFFREKMKQLDSYIRKIKHPYVFPIYRSVQKIFCDVRKEHYLGIQHNRFFKCRNTRLATLCIIKGKKK